MRLPYRRAAAPLLFASFAACWLAAAGCGKGEEQFYPVKGRVKVDGQPLKSAAGGIAFVPDATKGNTSKHEPRAEFSADGEYELHTAGRPGAPPGWYKVLVLAQIEPASPTNPYAVPKWAVPPDYLKADKTPLAVEVIAEPAPGAYDFDVKKK